MGSKKDKKIQPQNDRLLTAAQDKSVSSDGVCNVLVADDEPSILSLLQWAIRDLGCRATCAHGGRTALDRLCEEYFDLLITDLRMPDIDGFILMKMARKLHPGIKIIAMTGSTELVPFVLNSAPGVDGLLLKPFDLKELLHMINRCAKIQNPTDLPGLNHRVASSSAPAKPYLQV